ncbi:hypothetical protein NDU88_006037 [Pleurodeles waltl]|uniref:Uncharacterized protein n=1 Tax=Pleurodeles waltl TaxID=8319 RepID=A0AAV7UJW2_PLEWA|nr:hypothetical protein NDU88_006037 [Pleurodeles waltl]
MLVPEEALQEPEKLVGVAKALSYVEEEMAKEKRMATQREKKIPMWKDTFFVKVHKAVFSTCVWGRYYNSIRDSEV